MQVITNSPQYNLTRMDKKNISVQFVTVISQGRLTFEIIFFCQVLVTLEGTSVMDLYQFVFNTVEERLLFPSSYNVTTLTYPTNDDFVFFFTDDKP